MHTAVVKGRWMTPHEATTRTHSHGEAAAGPQCSGGRARILYHNIYIRQTTGCEREVLRLWGGSWATFCYRWRPMGQTLHSGHILFWDKIMICELLCQSMNYFLSWNLKLEISNSSLKSMWWLQDITNINNSWKGIILTEMHIECSMIINIKL